MPPHCWTMHPLHEHCIHIPGQCRGHCNYCRDTASTFMRTASSVITYCIHLVGHCIHCLATASTFPGNAGGTATTAATLHPAEASLHLHCHHYKITAFTFMGTAYYNTPQCLHIVGHYIHCMFTASTFRDIAPCTSTTARSLNPPSFALHSPSQHTACTLWDTASNAQTLQPRSRTM